MLAGTVYEFTNFVLTLITATTISYISILGFSQLSGFFLAQIYRITENLNFRNRKLCPLHAEGLCAPQLQLLLSCPSNWPGKKIFRSQSPESQQEGILILNFSTLSRPKQCGSLHLSIRFPLYLQQCNELGACGKIEYYTI